MTLEGLQHLRDDWNDEVPDEIIHNWGNFKVRMAWWQSLVLDLEVLERRGKISKDLQEEVNKFVKHYTSDEFHKQKLTTAEDIGRANNLIDRILGR